MMARFALRAALTTALACAALAPRAVQAQSPQLTLARAQAALAAATAEAQRQNWGVVIAVVDLAGELVLFQRMDDVQYASVDLAIGKARTAARFRRPTRVLADAVAQGRSGFLGVPGVVPLEGGVPIVVDGVVIGAVGVSGVTSAQDAQVAEAGTAAAAAYR